MEVLITAKTLRSGELIERLTATCAQEGVDFLLRKPTDAFRTLEPTVVVALITSSGAALAALATAIVGIARESKARRVALRDKEGRTIEYPANLSANQVQNLIDTLHRMEAGRIQID